MTRHVGPEEPRCAPKEPQKGPEEPQKSPGLTHGLERMGLRSKFGGHACTACPQERPAVACTAALVSPPFPSATACGESESVLYRVCAAGPPMKPALTTTMPLGPKPRGRHHLAARMRTWRNMYVGGPDGRTRSGDHEAAGTDTFRDASSFIAVGASRRNASDTSGHDRSDVLLLALPAAGVPRPSNAALTAPPLHTGSGLCSLSVTRLSQPEAPPPRPPV